MNEKGIGISIYKVYQYECFREVKDEAIRKIIHEVNREAIFPQDH